MIETITVIISIKFNFVLNLSNYDVRSLAIDIL